MLILEIVKTMLEMRKRGANLDEIAAFAGLSNHQAANVISVMRDERSGLWHSKYPVIAEWQMLNGVSMYRMSIETGITKSAISCLHTGKNDPSKFVIDKVLKYTGLTYEEAFREAAG